MYESDHNYTANITSNVCGGIGRSNPSDEFGLCVTQNPLNTYQIGDFLYSNHYIGSIPSGPSNGNGPFCGGDYAYYTDSTGTHFQISTTLQYPSAQDVATTTNGALPNWSECPEGNYRLTGSI